ncbi:MAG: excinuclease ABC subunit UvrA [Thermoanaerobaculia bacterium]|nr:excinuclease ABC subunit UvrA [Thermoanaerobaculia bacterium]
MSPTDSSAIRVVGARTHNLKGVDCRVPHGKLTVVTGPSGAGKSSLAFDTIYAEGQRRFVESMSTYARQFLEQMERPPVDSLDGVQPAVALEAKNSVKNARSTVGTVTEVLDVLRLLYTHVGRVHCPNGHGRVVALAVEEIAQRLVSGVAGKRFTLVARVNRPVKGADRSLAELVRLGHARILVDGEVERLDSSAEWPSELDPLPLVLGRFRADEEVRSRLAEAVEEALKLGRGRLEAHGDAVLHFGRGLICATCGEELRRPVPALFSFNSPLGACDECQGFGRIIGVDRERVIPDPSLTLEERPIAPWGTPAYEDLYDELFEACRERGVPLDVPWRELDEEHRRWIWSGDGDFVSIDDFFAWLERKNYRVHIRVLLAKYRAYDPCPVCDGSRLQPEARAVLVGGRTLPELAAMSIEELRRWLEALELEPGERARAGHLLEQLAERLEVLHRVGLDYLTLDRQARTLSGGETQRIHLAAALGSGLTSTLYVLDEPTIGLHPCDSARLLDLLKDLASRGNTVLVVEHDRIVVRGADHLIDLGPSAGERGGEVVAEGALDEVLGHPESLTAAFLRDRPPTAARDHLERRRRERGLGSLAEELAERPRVGVRGARANNLAGFELDLPLGALVVVCGVSGSGKSTLVENVLWANYRRSQGTVDVEPGACDELVGLEAVEDVVLVDQQALGRSSRSNPVTYVKAYDHIRKLYADQPRARRLGITPGHFSFNVDKGRCPECKGTGETEVDMQFMAPVTVTCDSCGGRRFKPEVLSVTVQGRTIAETLELTVAEAARLFSQQRALSNKLQRLIDVGLGYLRLGQSTATLSGGEAQRLKLASFLDRPEGKPYLFLFDEPTTGLHLADIEQLLSTLRRLVRRGDGVVVVEHSLDVLAQADWIVDLGPGAGAHGGELLYSGPREGYLETVDSPTSRELAAFLAGTRIES